MRVLITGAGLIGTHTAKELIERGDDITFFDCAPKSDYIRRVTGRNVTVIRGDIRDLAALIEAFQQTRAECVLHLAASVGKPTSTTFMRAFRLIWWEPSMSLKRRASPVFGGWSMQARKHCM